MFYVGITRAQDILILTGAEKHKVKSWKRSRFLDYIPDNMYSDDIITKSEKYYSVAKDTPMLSYSAVNVFLGCPLRYDFIYNYGFEYPQINTQALGLSIHNTLQKIHEAIKNNIELDNAEINKILDENWIDMPVPKKENENFKKSLRKKFYDYYRETASQYKDIIAIEEPFSYIDDNMIIKGKVDLIVKDNQDRLSLIDFKSRTLQGLEETNVGKQLQIYNHCLESEYNIDSLIAYAFFDNMKKEFLQNGDEIKSFLNDISEKIKHDKFEKKMSDFCKQCHFNFYCKKD